MDMWFTLAFATLASLVVLYAPGYLLGRAVAFGRVPALAIAPVFSSLLFVVLGLVLRALDLMCPAWVLFVAGFVICAVVYGGVTTSRRFCHIEGVTKSTGCCHTLDVADERESWKMAGLYVGVSFVVTFFVFIIAIGAPDAFARNDDTTQHFAMIRGMLSTGTFSTLHMSPSLDLGSHGSFYPGAWHVLVAIVASVFGDGVTLATNAMTIAFVAFVFPLGLYLLFDRIFSAKRAVIIAGSLFATAFCGFPWGYLTWGQLFPNMMSWVFIPPVMVMLMAAVDTRELGKRICLIVCVVIGLMSIAIAQPNGVFTFGMWAVFWGVCRFFYDPGERRAVVTRARVFGAIGLFVGACVLWGLIFVSPFMQAYVSYSWAAKESLLGSLGAGLLFMFSGRQGIEPALSILVLLGVIYAFRNRRYLWLVVAYVVAFVFFVIDMSTSGFVKQLLTAFWYTDPNRTGAMAAFFAMPLAALGFAWLWEMVRALFFCRGRASLDPRADHRSAPTEIPRVEQSSTPAKGDARNRIVAGVLVVLLFVIQLLPVCIDVGDTTIRFGLFKTHNEIAHRYARDNVYTAEEEAFVKRVMEEIPEGAMVINVPNDGSCYAYGVNGLNTFFRRSSKQGVASAQTSDLLRTKLKDVADKKKVRKELEKLGARYLLILDDVSGDDRSVTSLRYKKKDWKGIESITEDTPGFELVLSEGDMRLYEIVSVE